MRREKKEGIRLLGGPEIVRVGLCSPLRVGADAYAGAAVHPVVAPVLEALLRIHVPLERTWAAALRRGFPIGVVLEADGVDLADLGAPLTSPTELGDAEVDWLVGDEGKVGEDLEEADPWPVLGRDEETVSPKLPKPRVDRHRHAEPHVVPCGYRRVAEVPYELGKGRRDKRHP